MSVEHWVSAACAGERCSMCRAPATHKVGEERMFDDRRRPAHGLTAYVCCRCFVLIMGREDFPRETVTLG